MAFLRLVLNTAAIWWLVGGLGLLCTIAPHFRGSAVLFIMVVFWMIGIIPSVVLSATSSRNPFDDLRSAWYALKRYCLILGCIFGSGAVIAVIFAISNI